VLGVAERAALLGNPHRPDFSRPRIHILKQVPVNGPVMRIVQAAGGKGFGGALRGNFCFEGFERRLIPQAEPVLEDSRAGITVWVGDRLVHGRRVSPCGER